MSLEYTVHAYSPQLNQEIRQFNLEGGANNSYTSELDANNWAQSLAQRLNNEKFMTVNDWQARVKFEDLGIHTIPGYISSN